MFGIGMCLFWVVLVVQGGAYQFRCNDSEWKKMPRLVLNQREILAPTKHNFSMVVDATDQMVSDKILVRGTWQPQIHLLISKLVKPGQTILNLGAQLGEEALLMGKLMEGRGKIYAFEPFSVSYRMLVKSVYLNQLEHMFVCLRMAAGDRKHSMRLEIDAQNTGHSHLFQGASDPDATFQEVQIDTVDSILPEKTRLDFALIDVQSHEVQALLGMRQILSQSPSIIVLVEWRYLKNLYRMEHITEQLLKELDKGQFRWVRYKNGGECTLGELEYLQWNDMLQIQEEDILLIGPEVHLQELLGK